VSVGNGVSRKRGDYLWLRYSSLDVGAFPGVRGGMDVISADNS
jgi:hypothetical protein